MRLYPPGRGIDMVKRLVSIYRLFSYVHDTARRPRAVRFMGDP